jgi:hypothetical protein
MFARGLHLLPGQFVPMLQIRSYLSNLCKIILISLQEDAYEAFACPISPASLAMTSNYIKDFCSNFHQRKVIQFGNL